MPPDAQPFTATDGLSTIEQMNEPARRAWASTSTCNAVGNCTKPPTHFLRYRGKRTRRLACAKHARQAAEKCGLTIAVE